MRVAFLAISAFAASTLYACLKDVGSSRWTLEDLNKKNNANHKSHRAEHKHYFVPPLEDFQFCNKYNFMQMERTGPVGRNANNSLPEFSLQPIDFEPRHDESCSTASDIMNAIRNGQRVFPVQNLTWQQREETHSIFVPDKCDVPMRSHYDMCDAVDRFSHIVMQGDSLSRHVMKGLALALTNDLIRGSAFSSSESAFQCHCDSQFTEKHLACHSEIQFTWSVRPWERKMCSRLPTKNQVELIYNVNRLHKGVYKFSGVPEDCSQEKPLLVVVQGGLHMKYDSKTTFRKLIAPFFETPVVQECVRRGKVIFLWCAASFQSQSYYDAYPTQRDENAVRFSTEIADLFLQNNVTNFGTLDWANLTKDAWFSDGLHTAAQVNYFKAQHVMALATQMLDEHMFLQLPLENFKK